MSLNDARMDSLADKLDAKDEVVKDEVVKADVLKKVRVRKVIKKDTEVVDPQPVAKSKKD